ncbi:Protein kinase domain-containing protein [Mycena chlorophos]|uniref:Protein kinase domain-containing protein n=1 Tax=Mycena chlorophos TaxID=658473 RepID=A0A8H6T3U4_MYCCL|nr:Protein kinase domain-containing protein [Mycena chlorophos]
MFGHRETRREKAQKAFNEVIALYGTHNHGVSSDDHRNYHTLVREFNDALSTNLEASNKYWDELFDRAKGLKKRIRKSSDERRVNNVLDPLAGGSKKKSAHPAGYGHTPGQHSIEANMVMAGAAQSMNFTPQYFSQQAQQSDYSAIGYPAQYSQPPVYYGQAAQGAYGYQYPPPGASHSGYAHGGGPAAYGYGQAGPSAIAEEEDPQPRLSFDSLGSSMEGYHSGSSGHGGTGRQ